MSGPIVGLPSAKGSNLGKWWCNIINAVTVCEVSWIKSWVSHGISLKKIEGALSKELAALATQALDHWTFSDGTWRPAAVGSIWLPGCGGRGWKSTVDRSAWIAQWLLKIGGVLRGAFGSIRWTAMFKYFWAGNMSSIGKCWSKVIGQVSAFRLSDTQPFANVFFPLGLLVTCFYRP